MKNEKLLSEIIEICEAIESYRQKIHDINEGLIAKKDGSKFNLEHRKKLCFEIINRLKSRAAAIINEL